MRAVHVTSLDGPDAVEMAEVDEPQPGPGDVVIDVRAAGVSWPDLLQSRGLYQIKPPLPFSPGAEVSGTVRSAPPGSGLETGARVAAFTFGGGWRDQVAVAAGMVFPVPDNVSWNAAAGFPLNYFTMHFALRRRTRLEPGETVLVHGATGGIGEATLRLAAVWGARTIAVVSTEAKADAARAMGADEVVLADGFLERARQLTDGHGVDLVVDPVGGDRFTDSLRALGREGRLLVIGFTGGEIPTVKVNRLLLNNAGVLGVGWGAFVAANPWYLGEQAAELFALLERGELQVPDGPEFPLEEAAAVLRQMDGRTLVGKAVLLP